MKDFNSEMNKILTDKDRAMINKHYALVEKMRKNDMGEYYTLLRVHYSSISYAQTFVYLNGGKFKKVFKETINKYCAMFDVPPSYPELGNG